MKYQWAPGEQRSAAQGPCLFPSVCIFLWPLNQTSWPSASIHGFVSSPCSQRPGTIASQRGVTGAEGPCELLSLIPSLLHADPCGSRLAEWQGSAQTPNHPPRDDRHLLRSALFPPASTEIPSGCQAPRRSPVSFHSTPASCVTSR